MIALLEPLLVTVGLALAVSFRFMEPIWSVRPGLAALGLLTGGSYVVGYAACRASARRGVGRAFLWAIVVTQPVLLTLLFLDLPLSRMAIAGELSLLFGWLLIGAARVPGSIRIGAAATFAVLAAYPTAGGLLGAEGRRSVPPASDARYVFSSYHDLSVSRQTVFEDETQDGGAMTLLPGNRVLLVAGSGDARILEVKHRLKASAIDLGLPIDVAAYRSGVSAPMPTYRVTDVLYTDHRLLAVYTHWDAERDCYTLRLVEAPFEGATAGSWTTRFESQPCLTLPYLNNESGGQIAVLDPSHLLLSLGTFDIDDGAYPDWRENSDYGKILELDTETWQASVFTRGHRNPEGLLVADGRVWNTEDGPQGGDELNLLEASRDYGWPSVSYGTDYGMKTLSSGRAPGDHSGFEAPVYAWLPSIGITDLIRVSSKLFPSWRGDLLIGSLNGLGNGRGIFRVRLRKGRAVSVERIPMESTVRDLMEVPDGPLVLWDGKHTVRVVRPAENVFAPCTGCHAVREANQGIGPDLWNVVGSPVARQSGFGYSTAMRSYGGVWTPARLDRFLEDPHVEIPGTTMTFEGVSDPTARAEIIKYLTEMSGGRR